MTSLRRLIVVLLVALSVFTFIRTSHAQGLRSSNKSLPGAISRPAYSPYLNLLRRNTGPVQNYYGLVRPQQQFQANDELLDTNMQGLRREVKETEGMRLEKDQSTRLSESGHSARFMSDLRSGFGPSINSRYDDSKTGKDKLTGSRLGTSGHTASFGNTGSYFPSARR